MDLNDLTYQINGAAFEVSSILGPGFLEKVYENALLLELRKRNLKAVNQVPINVLYKGENVGEYVADILVEDQVVIELKTVDKLEKIHEAQILCYLKATGIKVGLLMNFKKSKVEIKRMVLNL
ncbi:MAG: GxxExxY protein [Desulfobacteraceae bacterium]|nr:MAG: GxxExxY protein [Desulfobacteraceae bacterium]